MEKLLFFVIWHRSLLILNIFVIYLHLLTKRKFWDGNHIAGDVAKIF